MEAVQMSSSNNPKNSCKIKGIIGRNLYPNKQSDYDLINGTVIKELVEKPIQNLATFVIQYFALEIFVHSEKLL